MSADSPSLGPIVAALARRAIEARLLDLPAPEPCEDDRLAVPAAGFVTVRVHDDLRGCIGRMDAIEPLGAVIVQCAVAAAFADPRFEPVRLEELAALEVEVSVLSPLRLLQDPSALEVGRHGLVIERGGRRGLLLPRVATEHGWSAAEFLQHTCRKAGLPIDAWRDGATLWVFEAEVYEEAPHAV